MTADSPTTDPPDSFDAIVIGAGHNGLVCAAYLARGGMRTLLVEARSGVGGTATSEQWSGATVNICACDHLIFRTTPVIDELGLADHGLRYIDLEPAGLNVAWSGGPAWAAYHSVEQTLDSLAHTHPGEVEGYRRYLKAALPAARMVITAANEPPGVRSLTRKVVARRGRGVTTLMRWSRRSAADVMREFFRTDAVQAPGMVVGPMVWGTSPETKGTGLGALTYAMRHAAKVGRPLGGAGEVPRTLLAAFRSAGGTTLLDTKVSEITCEGDAVRGVVLDDGREVTAKIVVSACNPHDTFLRWLRNAPPQADRLVRRWKAAEHADGYESKIDAVLSAVPRLRPVVEAGLDVDLAASTVIAPSLAEMHRGYQRMMHDGTVLERPAMMVNVPSVADPGLAPPGRHVFSLEALFTPYGFPGGWASSAEPRRWLDLYGELAGPGFSDSIVDWRAMTPDRYETEFHLPHGHATSFTGGPMAALFNKNPELTRYETPVRGLYITGAATFPGAGVWGASGRNAALVVLAQRT